MNLQSLLPDVLGRIEESNPPVFWSLTGEVYPQMVYALFESALISGVVQVNSQLVTLAANTTWFSIQGASSVLPTVPGLIAPLRIRAAYSIRKTTLKGLDDMFPNWQTAAASEQIVAWFPLGVSGFGIYPQLDADSQVTMDFLSCPVNEYRPYTGNETIPFQSEFLPLLSKYAGAMLRVKEGGAEAEEADIVFKEYLDEVKALSQFQQRLDSVVYSRAFGGNAQVNPRKVV